MGRSRFFPWITASLALSLVAASSSDAAVAGRKALPSRLYGVTLGSSVKRSLRPRQIDQRADGTKDYAVKAPAADKRLTQYSVSATAAGIIYELTATKVIRGARSPEPCLPAFNGVRASLEARDGPADYANGHALIWYRYSDDGHVIQRLSVDVAKDDILGQCSTFVTLDDFRFRDGVSAP